MAHMIDRTTGKAAVFVVGDPPWHKLGTVIDKAATSEEAIRLACLDWQVGKRQLFTEDGTAVKGAFATYRHDTNAILGVVGARYTPFQNLDAFKFMDALVGEQLAMYETAGALCGGQRVWMLARIPKELRVNGTEDVIEPYVMLTNTHDGTGSITMLPTSVRVVCQNTLNLALRECRNGGLRIRHTASVEQSVEDARQNLGIVLRGVETFQEQINHLAGKQWDKKQLADYFDQLFPTGIVKTDGASLVSDEDSEGIAERNRKILEMVQANFEHDTNKLPGIEGSAWAAYNAVSEYADWQHKVRGKNDLARTDARMNSIFFGAANDLKQRAFDLCLALAA
jgi:phage/plasmid-like protein (TIGR03299 family)